MKSIIKWLFFVAIFVTIIVFGLKSAKKEVIKNKQEDVKTEMLQVQGKAKIVFENYHVNNDNGLKGEKMEDTSLEEKYDISDIANFYKWNRDILIEEGIPDPILEGEEYYLINYDTEEVVYSEGYMAEDGTTYYKLSNIKEAEIKEETVEEASPNAEEQQNEEEVKEDDGEGTNKAE